MIGLLGNWGVFIVSHLVLAMEMETPKKLNIIIEASIECGDVYGSRKSSESGSSLPFIIG